MALPSYQVVVIDPTSGDVTNIYDNTAFIDLRYSRVLNGIGLLALLLPGTDLNYETFTLDSLIEVQRTDPATGALIVEDTYFCRLRERYRDDRIERVVIGGVSLNHLLMRRVVRPEDDPAVAGGYSTKDGPADTVIRAYVREQAADLASAARQFPGFTVNSVAGSGQPVGARLRYENLLDVVEDLSKRGQVDFQIRRTTGASMALTIGRAGVDRTKTTNYPNAPWVGLDPRRGNLTNPTLTEDRKEERNYIYALGQGQGDTRIVLAIAGATVYDSPFNRIEFAQDVRNVEKGDALALLTAAQAELAKRVIRLGFEFEPLGVEPGNIYRLDWDVGDSITVIWSGVDRDLRVTDVEISASGQSQDGETLKIGLEDLETS